MIRSELAHVTKASSSFAPKWRCGLRILRPSPRKSILTSPHKAGCGA